MKILLIYPPADSVYGLPRYPTLGITYLATVLYQQGFMVEVLDMRFPHNDFISLKAKLRFLKPDIVGVGSTSFDFPGAKKIFRLVKRTLPRSVTILGGPHASVCFKEVMKEGIVDHLFIGEVEEELPRFVKAIQQNKKVKSLIRAKLINDLDRLPFPKWDLFPLDDYRVRGKLRLPLMTSRGCPFSCIYCVSWKAHGKKFRFRSPENVVDEIENDIICYGAKNFSFLDDNFTLDPQRALEICREIIRRGLKITWTCDQGIRADAVDKKLFLAMRKSGCRLVALGVESAEQEVLDKMKKAEKVVRIRQAIRAAKEAGLTVKAFFIVGGPGDSLGVTRKSIKFFKETDIDIPRFGMMTAYPGSELWQWVQNNGNFLGDPYDHILKSPTTANKVQFETNDFSGKERLRAFALAEAEAEKWTIYKRLVRFFGPLLASVFILPFSFKFLRDLLKKIYRLKIFSVTD